MKIIGCITNQDFKSAKYEIECSKHQDKKLHEEKIIQLLFQLKVTQFLCKTKLLLLYHVM